MTLKKLFNNWRETLEPLFEAKLDLREQEHLCDEHKGEDDILCDPYHEYHTDAIWEAEETESKAWDNLISSIDDLEYEVRDLSK